MFMISLKKINKIYRNGEGKTLVALNDVSLELPCFGMVFLLGKSGSGKTTLLNIIGGLDNADGGIYEFDGKNVSDYKEKEWDEFRNCKIGFVFQEFNLIDDLSVYKNIEIALNIQDKQLNNEKKINNILEKLDIQTLQNRKVNQLSGGQIQRVAIARAIAKDSAIILADEPTGNLDEYNSLEIYTLLHELSKNRLVLVVTHDEKMAYRFGDRIIKLSDGKIISDISSIQSNYTILLENENESKIFTGTRSEIVDKYLSLLDVNNSTQDYHIKIKKELVANKPSLNNNKSDIIRQARCLPLKDSIFFAFNSMKKRKFRHILTVFLFSLTAVLLFFSITLSTYNISAVIRSYYRQYPSKEYYIYQTVSYENSFFIKQSKQIDSGKKIYDDMNKVSHGRIAGRLQSKNIASVNYENTTTVNAVIGNNLIEEKLIGRLPQSDEIVITDFLLEKLGMNSENAIGSRILYEDTEMTISGYVSTDYMQYGLYDKLRENPLNPYANLALEREYSVVYLSDNFFDVYYPANLLQLKGADIVYSDYLSRYLDSYATYSSFDNDLEISLIYGDIPKNGDEILISNEYLQRFLNSGSNIESILNETIILPNIYASEYAGFYNDYINLYDYFSNGVKIVGVYDQSTDISYRGANILIETDKYNLMRDNFYSYFIYDSFILLTENDSDTVVNQILELGMNFDEIAFSFVNSLKSVLNDILPFIIIIIIILTLITVFLNISCISYNIKDNSKTIAVLRALGLTKKDTLCIFILETFIICFETVLFTLCLSFLGVFFINYIFQLSLTEKAFKIIYFDSLIFIAIAGIVCLIGLICSSFPIGHFANKRPIEIIKG